MSNTVTYSIVIPVYKSAASLVELCQGIHAVMQQFTYEIIVVDDGSTDTSWAVIETISVDNKNVVGIRLSRNYGQHSAILCGFTFCRGEYVITMDDDLQHPPAEIAKLITKQQLTNADVVYGIYLAKQHSFARNAGSFYIRKSSIITEGNKGYGSSFRLIKKTVVDKIVTNQASSFYFLDELLYWYTGSFERVEVIHAPRKYGQSGYSVAKLFKLYTDIVFNYSSFPLRLMTYAGFVFSIITFATAMFFIFRKLFFKGHFGFTALMVTVLFTASVLMFCMGIIGQYLFKIYQSQHAKPLYSIREIKNR